MVLVGKVHYVYGTDVPHYFCEKKEDWGFANTFVDLDDYVGKSMLEAGLDRINVFAAMIRCGNLKLRDEQATPRAPSYDPPVSVNADDLFRAYKANEVLADQQYKGRALEVTGAVQAIKKDFTNDIYVEIWSPNEFMPIRARGISEQAASALTVGQHVTLSCIGDGMAIGAPDLEDCSVR